MATGDFNSDGDPDLAVASDASESVAILTGGLGGTFTLAGTVSLAGSGGADSVAVGDFNANSDPDLAITSSNGDTVKTFLGEAGATFSSSPTLNTGDAPTFVAIRDLNGDNDPELIVANAGSDNLTIFQADAAARFLPTPVATVAAGDNPSAVAIGNFDADLDPDLAVTNRGQPSAAGADTVSILTGTGGAAITFALTSTVVVGDVPTWSR